MPSAPLFPPWKRERNREREREREKASPTYQSRNHGMQCIYVFLWRAAAVKNCTYPPNHPSNTQITEQWAKKRAMGQRNEQHRLFISLGLDIHHEIQECWCFFCFCFFLFYLFLFLVFFQWQTLLYITVILVFTCLFLLSICPPSFSFVTSSTLFGASECVCVCVFFIVL